MSQQPNSPSRVHFWDLGTTRHACFETKLRGLLKAARIGSQLQSRDLTAVKIHFGERGTTSFIPPLWLGPILSFLRKCGARPFLTDTNTLYPGSRENGVSHALLAREHGFDAALLRTPVLIADGLKGTHEIEVPLQGKHFRTCYLAGEVGAADAMLTCSHFTGHGLAGFAGALKNLAMGCASKRGKMRQHSTTGPAVRPEKCSGCGACHRVCPTGALIREEERTTGLASELCTGCARCITACPEAALRPNWDCGGRDFLERMGEYAAAVLSLFQTPVLHLNFLLGITPECDCEGHSSPPLCPDIGIAASYDPVALDQASLDLVNGALKKSHPPLERFHPGIDGEHLLAQAESLGIGSRNYTLIRV
jgi:hypothetical protein